MAREAQLCYASLCIVTDYDAGVADGEAGNVGDILAEYRRSIGRVREILAQLVSTPPAAASCRCRNSLAPALLTSEDDLSAAQRELLRTLMS